VFSSGDGGGVAQTMYTHVSKCKNNKTYFPVLMKPTFMYLEKKTVGKAELRFCEVE
jgi:hypothetical protein